MSDPSQRLADEQTAAERRALRADYRTVYGEVVEGKEQLANAKSGDLQRVLRKVQGLHERAQRPKEYAVDAEVFAQLAACGLDMVRRGAASSKKRMPADFVSQLKTAFGLGCGGRRGGGGGAAAAASQPCEINWSALGLAAVSTGVFATAPGAGTMHGPLGEAPKPPSDKKKAAAAAAAAGRRKRVRMTAEEMEAAAGPKIKPREVTDDLGAANPDGDDKQETDRQMDAMWEALMERADPDAEQAPQRGEDGEDNAEAGVSRTFVDVASLVVNHQSFAQTVENMFTLSFLVRDQRVRLEHDPEVGLVVRPFSLEQQRAIKEGSAAESAAAAAVAGVAAGSGGAGANGRGVGGRGGTRGGAGGNAAATAAGQQQQQHMAQQFVVRFTHEDWEIMKAIVPRGQAVTPHRVLGEGLEREERRAREDAAAAQRQARQEQGAREAARREQDAADEERRAAQRARRQSERERMEKELRAFGQDGMEDGEAEGDENAEAGGGGTGSGAAAAGKKRARASGGGGGAGGAADGVVDLVDDVDVGDNRTGKTMRV